MQLRNVPKKIRQINGTLSRKGQKAVVLSSDIANQLIKRKDAQDFSA